MTPSTVLAFLLGFFLGEWFMAWRWKYTERRKARKGGIENE